MHTPLQKTRFSVLPSNAQAIIFGHLNDSNFDTVRKLSRDAHIIWKRRVHHAAQQWLRLESSLRKIATAYKRLASPWTLIEPPVRKPTPQGGYMEQTKTRDHRADAILIESIISKFAPDITRWKWRYEIDDSSYMTTVKRAKDIRVRPTDFITTLFLDIEYDIVPLDEFIPMLIKMRLTITRGYEEDIHTVGIMYDGSSKLHVELPHMTWSFTYREFRGGADIDVSEFRWRHAIAHHPQDHYERHVTTSLEHVEKNIRNKKQNSDILREMGYLEQVLKAAGVHMAPAGNGEHGEEIRLLQPHENGYHPKYNTTKPLHRSIGMMHHKEHHRIMANE